MTSEERLDLAEFRGKPSTGKTSTLGRIRVWPHDYQAVGNPLFDGPVTFGYGDAPAQVVNMSGLTAEMAHDLTHRCRRWRTHPEQG
jgi:hypothetical protein